MLWDSGSFDSIFKKMRTNLQADIIVNFYPSFIEIKTRCSE